MDHSDNNGDKQKDNIIKPKFSNGGNSDYGDGRLPIWYVKSKNAINYVLGVIEVLLAFRFLFKLLGANPHSGFVAFLYSLTGIFIAPFSGIFNSYTTSGLDVRSVFEPATIIAIAGYAVIAWGLVKLIRLKAVRDGY